MSNPTRLLPSFETQEQAIQWLVDRLVAEDELCIDNERFAFKDDHRAMGNYTFLAESGCCGSVDEEVVVAGRQALVGCNYGH